MELNSKPSKPNFGTEDTKHNLSKASLGFDEGVKFTGVIVEKLPNAVFKVLLTQMPNGEKPDKDVIITGKVTGKIQNRKIRMTVHDVVIVLISMASAQTKSGFITYRERGKAHNPDLKQKK